MEYEWNIHIYIYIYIYIYMYIYICIYIYQWLIEYECNINGIWTEYICSASVLPMVHHTQRVAPVFLWTTRVAHLPIIVLGEGAEAACAGVDASSFWEWGISSHPPCLLAAWIGSCIWPRPAKKAHGGYTQILWLGHPWESGWYWQQIPSTNRIL